MKKSASILDYSMPTLDPAVWDQDMKLFAYHKDFILRLLNSMYENYQLKQPEVWITDICIIGSLTTSKWLFTSDLDVHLHIDLAKFIEINMPGTDPKIAFEYLDTTRKEFDRAKILAPMTQHPIEYYFEVPEFVATNTTLVGIYSILQDKWLKEPVLFEADADFEESKKQVAAEAEALAEELEGSFGKIDRQIKRIDELERLVNAWGSDKQQLFYKKIEDKLRIIEEEILKDIKLREELIETRHAAQDPMADIEIKFKWLARFGFFGILTNLKNLLKETGGKITTQELPLVERIISEGSIKEAASDYQAWWIDPNSKVYGIDITHDDWVADQWKMLRDQYGYKDIEQFFSNPNLEFDEIRAYLVSKGWSRAGDLSNGNFGIQVNDLLHIPNGVFDFLLDHQVGLNKTMFEDVNGRWISVPNDELVEGQKAVNKALSGKRMRSMKEAFLKEAFETEPKETDTDICVDFDRTIAKPAKHPAIGEPIDGAKESLAKLKELGYNVIIYSCRGDSEEGLKAMEEWLDKHEMPYDSIFSGEKPFYRFLIDDRAIQFDSWDKVMKKVEKSNKTASSSILKVEPYGGGIEFPVLVNPSRQQVARSLKQTEMGELRVIQGNNSYIWDAAKATHEHVLQYLVEQGLEEYSNVQTGYVLNPSDIDEFSWGTKAASLAIVAATVNLPTIDPKTLNRKEPYALFIGTGDYGSAGKIDMFNVYGEHPMITKSNALPTVTLDTLIQNNIPVIGKEPRAGEKQPFQDISGIVKKAYSSIGTNKYWITPAGKIIQIGQSEMHVDWIAHHLVQLFKMGVDVEDLDQPLASYKGRYFDDLSENDQPTLERIMNNMQAEGWVRITSDDARTQFTIDAVNDFGPGVDQFIAEHFDPNAKKPIGVFLRGGGYKEILDPFPTLAQAYQKALRNKHASFSKRDLIAKTKKVKQGDYSCLMALVPHELAQEIVEWGVRNVPDGELYLSEDGKFGRELEPHVTIKYGLLTNDAKYVRRSFNEDKPFHAKLGKVRHFEPPELPFDVLTIEVISEDLNKANEKVCKKFDCAKGLVSDEYKSHITIAYMKRGKAKDFIGYDGFNGKEVDLDTVIFSPRKGNRTYFSISQDKESSFILEQINKFAGMDIGYWVDPKGDIYDVHGAGMIHNEWVLNNLEMLEKDYGINVPPELYDERLAYLQAVEEQGDDENLDPPSSGDVWHQMIQQGWVRVGDADEGIGIEVNDLRKIPPFMDNILAEDLRDGLMVRVEDIGHTMISVQYPFKNLQQAVNEALVGQSKYASGDNFLPSLFNAPNNEWQFEHGGDDQEIALNPDPVSDETTWYAPCTEGKPRTKEVWRQFMSIFRNPFSKKEEMTVDSAYDPELEQKEKDALGEDETLLEYSKGFYDPKKHDFPHNTTWDSLTQDGEPSKPTSVTYSPEMNEDNLDQNSPGGYPRRFMGKPKGEWFSNEGEVNEFLINMLRNRQAAVIAGMTKEAFLQHGYWIDPNGKVFEVRGAGEFDDNDYTHWQWVMDNLDMLKDDYGITDLDKSDYSKSLVAHGWTRIGDSIDATQWQVQTADLHAINKAVDNVLAQFVPEGATIDFTDSKNLFVTLTWPWKNAQVAVNKALRQPVMAKQASIEEVNGIPVLVNPSPNEVKGLLRKGSLRALIDPETGDMFAWDAAKSEHDSMIRFFGLAIDWETDDGTYIRHVVDQVDLDELFQIQQDVRENLRRKKKKASIERVDDVNVLMNPSRQEMEGLVRTLRGDRIRGLIDPHTGDLFVWDAYKMEHIPMINALGLDLKYDMDSPYVLYFTPSMIDEILAKPQELKQKRQVAAGSYSSTYTDEQGEEMYNDQHMNDTDEEPYVNHDQRDYPYGMHDSPENTGFNIGWAKDNQPYVVRLDILENPAYRSDPFGIGEYNVTWYESLPAGDGIEATNPD